MRSIDPMSDYRFSWHRWRASVLNLVFCLIFIAAGSIETDGRGIVREDAGEGYFPVNGTKLYYLIIGEGDPLVILHGGPGLSHDYLVSHLKFLDDRHQLIFYDQRASGNSPMDVSPESLTIESFVSDIEAVRSFLGIEKMTLLGHSWGGLLAMHYAASFPGRVLRMILVDSAPPNSRLDEKNFQTRAKRLAGEDAEKIDSIAESEAFHQLEPEAVRSYLMLSEKARFFNPELISELSMKIDREKIEKLIWVGQVMNPGLADYDIEAKLKGIDCPCLIVHGDYDPIPLESAEIIHRSIQGSELVVIEDCGHFPFIESPKRFSRVVETFLEKTSDR